VEWDEYRLVSNETKGAEMSYSVINMRYPLNPNGNYTCHKV